MLSSLLPSCPPSLTVAWQPVTSDDLNGPAEEAHYVVMWGVGESGEEEEETMNSTVPFSVNTMVGN